MKEVNSLKTGINKAKLLETFENSHPQRDYLITHQTDEFTSVCPKTGQPDFGIITITYIAGKKCVELKSLKFYLHSFRNEGIFYEDSVNRILDDLVKVLRPKWIEVSGSFALRGGIRSIVTAEYGKR